MNRMEVKIAGFGGQGIVLAGYIIGKAAAVFDGKNAVQTQSYGPEARGGACSADVVIDTASIDYPLAGEVDVLILMSQEAYHMYRSDMKKEGLLIIDEDLVHLSESDRVGRLLRIPATRFAEKLGRRIVSNIVMLGFFTATANSIGYDSMLKAVLDSIPEGTEELNTKAFNLGFDYGLSQPGKAHHQGREARSSISEGAKE